MNKDEFFFYANNKPECNLPSFYELEITIYRTDIKGYHKIRGKNSWSFDVSKETQYYSSKEKAVEAYRKYISDIGPYYKPHSAVIFRIALDRDLDDMGRLGWWLYDSLGNEIDHSVSASECQRYQHLYEYYLGRKEDEIRFHAGDIVEILYSNYAFLAILNDQPMTINDVWKRYKGFCDEREPNPSDPQRLKLLPTGERDEYYYITSSWYDFDTAPYMIFIPTFRISKNVRTIYEGLFHSWEENVERLNNGEIEWEELQEKVIGKNKVR